MSKGVSWSANFILFLCNYGTEFVDFFENFLPVVTI